MQCPYCKNIIDIKQRSNNQNRYYWSVIIGTLSDHTGFTPEEMHEVLKHKFLHKDLVVKEKSKVYFMNIPTSTAKLNTSEMEHYLTQIREWASLDLGCYLPLPNETMQEAS